MRPKLKATGSQGSWFATVSGRSLPCIHDYWLTRMHYRDPGAVPGEKKWDELYRAIKEGKEVILTKSGPGPDSAAFVRKGYIGIFAAENVSMDANGLQLDLVDRLADLE